MIQVTVLLVLLVTPVASQFVATSKADNQDFRSRRLVNAPSQILPPPAHAHV